MGVNHLLSTSSSLRYPIEMIQEEVRQLVEKGIVSRQQSIHALRQYIPAREWISVERELEKCEYLMRDRLGDLIGSERWNND